ncbi:pyridoxal phosphate-dependent aminotransferase [candidate division KSB1 bacterium]|nr:pyridoxal phosphate-dependent aminotransferase [candidate division KSB1 bacterium]
MRRQIVHEGAEQLTYEIREIVAVAHEFEKLGVNIIWENIGDPIQKGERMPAWIKDIVAGLAMQDCSYSYCDTQGVRTTRRFLADEVNKRGGCQVTADDIIFFNGLGDAVARIFGALRREARVIGPSPAYSTYSSAEAAHSGYEHLTYQLDPTHRWMPDLGDLENKVKYNDSIAGILLINPDNPTGTVYPREFLQKIVRIAKDNRVFIMCDEIYIHIVYNGAATCHLSEVIEDLPGISLRGISKEFPWPGSRCGWLEVFNQNKYPAFQRYISSLINAKRLEVCSTSLPQYVIPQVIGDPRYRDHLEKRRRLFEARANEACDILEQVDEIYVNRPQGAFYLSVLFNEGVLNFQQELQIQNHAIRRAVEEKVQNVAIDKRFVYYLLGATGICVVPLSGFCTGRHGFRVTLLETDDGKRRWTWETLVRAIKEYVHSAPSE